MRIAAKLAAAALTVLCAGAAVTDAAFARRGGDDDRGRGRGDDHRYCAVDPGAKKMSAADAAARAEALGYTNIREIEWDDGCWEVYARNSAGHRVEVYLHPVSGDVVKIERD